MCNPAFFLAGAQLAMGSLQAASGMSAAKSQARELRRQGDQELMAASIDASNLRYAGGRQGSEILAQQAASGVDVSGGSAADVGAEHARNVELDALRVQYGGVLKRHSAYTQALLINKAARAEATGTILGSLISAGKTASGGFGGPQTSPGTVRITPQRGTIY